MDAWRGENTSFFQAGQASSRVLTETDSEGREDIVTAFAANAVDRPQVS